MATATNINGFNIGGNNNSFDQRGHFYRGVFSGNVSGMRVKQNSTPNMTVLVEHGSALLNKNTTSASVAEIKSDTSVTIDTANTSNPRIDTVVIYEDTSVATPTVEANYWQDGAGGRFKIVSLPGTAAASPVALSDASIQSAIGAGKPFTRLADITVPANSTTILNSNIADKRVQMGGTIPNKSITADKLDFATFPEITTQSNPGSAGGNLNLVKIGNLRYAFGTSINRTSGSSPNSPQSSTVTFPSGFFSSTPVCTVSVGGPLNSVATQVANVNTVSINSLSYYQFTTAGAGSAVVQWVAIGT